MTTHRHTTAIGVFTERAQADRALEALHNAGFTDDMIGFIQRDLRNADTGRAATDATEMPATADDKTGAAATGAVGGGILGGLLGAAAALVIPGIGPAIAGGILITTLGGAAIGAVAGGLIGALTSMGIPEDEARYYQQELEAGRTLVTVNAGDRYDEAVTILRGQGAYDVHARSGSQQPIAGAYDTQNTDPRYTTNEQRIYNRENYPVTNVEQPADAVGTSYTGSPVGAGAENYRTNNPQEDEDFQGNMQARPYSQNDPAYDQSAQQRYNQGMEQSETQSPFTQDQAGYSTNAGPGNDPYRVTDTPDTYNNPNADPNMAPRENYPYEERSDTINNPGSNQPNNPQRRRELRPEEIRKENTPPPVDNQY